MLGEAPRFPAAQGRCALRYMMPRRDAGTRGESGLHPRDVGCRVYAVQLAAVGTIPHRLLSSICFASRISWILSRGDISSWRDVSPVR